MDFRFFLLIGYNVCVDNEKKNSAFSIFITFFRVSLLTIGGGYAMVPVLAKSLEKKGWMDKKNFYTLLARSQSIPGSIAFNLSLLVGGEVAGWKGSIAGALGVMIPPFFAIVLVGSLLGMFSHSVVVIGFLKGAYGAIMGLIGGVLYKMITSRKWNVFEVVIMLVAAVLLIIDSKYVLEIFFLSVLIVWIGDKKWRS